MHIPKKLEPVHSLLSTNSTLVLATVGSNGVPRATALFFLAHPDLNLYWFSSRHSTHSRNCALFPEVSVAISSQARTWKQIRGVQMQGRVSLVADPLLRRSITAAYIERFALGTAFSLAIRGSSLYCFTPAWLRYIDNSRGFGNKFELNLSKRKRPNFDQRTSAARQ